MDPAPMDPSAVRERVLSDHQDIRRRLARFAELSARAPTDAAASEALRVDLLAFVPELEAHMRLEDDLLLPALMDADAFGDVRVDMLHDHHAHYRERADALASALGAPGADPTVVVAWATRLSDELAVEMADEERRLLRPDILRDDFVTSGVGG
ncbi:MAG: hemerythrin domain-containing protein [Alphaproteobacteria bacterium]|nr:hemerythrin domain-containing protein [Alphaproteobacteria bacterium]